MIPVRVIPCLLLREGGLVKTTGFARPVYLGDPVNTVKLYNDMEVDELIVLDIDATRRGAIDWDTLEMLTSECFMPLCYGGGVDSEDIAARLFSLGVEKVAMNHATLEHPALLTRLAERFGSQSVIAAIDVKKDLLGGRRVWNHLRGKSTGMDVIDRARRLEEMGAGELLVNSVDHDGRMRGYDIELMRAVSEAVKTPVIACGGAGDLEHMRELVSASEVRACAAGSLFVYQGPHRAVLMNYPSQEKLRAVFADIESDELQRLARVGEPV